MKKKGLYTIINNREYGFYKDIKKNYFLRDHNSMSLKEGFEDVGYGVYIKPIEKEELKECYEITNWAVYKGQKSMFQWYKKNKIILFPTDDLEFAKQHDYEVTDRGRYAIKLKVEDVQFVEEKTPYIVK